MLHRRFILVRRLLKATGEALVVCGVPLLQSVAGVCSDDKNYLTNREEADFEEILSAGVDDVDPNLKVRIRPRSHLQKEKAQQSAVD